MTYKDAINTDFDRYISQMYFVLNTLNKHLEVLQSLNIQKRLDDLESKTQISNLAEKISVIDILAQEKEFIKEKLAEANFPLGYPFAPIKAQTQIESADGQIQKVTKRVPTWFRKYFDKQKPCNGTILVRFLELSHQNTYPIKKQQLEEACKDILNFTSNYHNMRNMLPNNHGKVFEEIGGKITLWQPVANIVIEAYNNAKKTQGLSNLSISQIQIPRDSGMTDKQFNDAFTAAGGWFLLNSIEEIIELNNNYTSTQIAEILFEKGFDSDISGTQTRVSSILRLIKGGRIREAIEKVRDSARINNEHPQARSLAIEILKKISH